MSCRIISSSWRWSIESAIFSFFDLLLAKKGFPLFCTRALLIARKRPLDRGERAGIRLALRAREIHRDCAEIFVDRRDAGLPRAKRLDLARHDGMVAACD